MSIVKENLMDEFPEKSKELSEYMDSLPLTDDQEKNRGYLIQSLHRAQGIFGYLQEGVQLFVAKRLKLHLTDVYGVVSFYSYFTDKPVGDFKINVCTGTACFVKGADRLLEELTRFLHLEQGETSDDMKFSLGGLRCVGACSLAPVVMVNDKVYGNVAQKQVADIIEDCK